MATQAAQYSKGVAEAFKGAYAAIHDPETVKEAKSGLMWCLGVAVSINLLLACLSFPIVVLSLDSPIPTMLMLSIIASSSKYLLFVVPSRQLF